MKRALLLAAVAMLASAPAMATTFTYQSYSETPQTSNINISAPNAISGSMGQIVLHSGPNNTGNTLEAWCLDIYHYLQSSSTYTTFPLTTAGTGGSNPTLSTTQIWQIGSLMVNGGALIGSNALASAATQLAIWITEYGAGTFTYTGVTPSSIVTLANDMLGWLGNIWHCPTCSVTTLVDETKTNQTLGIGQAGQGNTPLPVPGAVWLFTSGLVGLGMIARRRRKATAAAA